MKYKVTIKGKSQIVDAKSWSDALAKAKANDEDIEQLSAEEEKAIEDYKKAIQGTNSVKLLKLYAHILKEETEHLEELQAEKVSDSIKDNIVKYYNSADINRPGVPDENFMNEQKQIASRFGVTFKKSNIGFWIEGEESKVRKMLSQWYTKSQIDKILAAEDVDY